MARRLHPNPIRSNKRARVKLALIRIALALGMPLLFLFCAEMILRIATTRSFYLTESNPHFQGPDGVVRLQPNTKTWWYGSHYQINAQGFRMPREAGPKEGFRILALGDSVTLGMGVRRTEEVWPNRLHSLLRESGHASMEVINSGVQGWNLLVYDSATNLVPAEFTRFVSERGAQLEPDLVIYCICLNDAPSGVEEVFALDNQKNKQRFKLFPEASREWFKRKAFYRLGRDAYRESRFHQLDFSAIVAPQPVAYWKEVAAELGRLKGAVEAIDAKLVCVLVPFSYQVLPANNELLEINRAWQEALDQNGIPWTDVTPHFDETNVLDYFALGDYIHLNAKGHDLIAREAIRLVEKELSVDALEPAGADRLAPPPLN